jgi:predicted RND superfamily exporter protein
MSSDLRPQSDAAGVDAALEAAEHHGPVHHHRPTGMVGRLSGAMVEASMARPKAVLVAAAVVTALMGLMFLRVDVDTDPENMLASDAPIRVLNAEIRETFDTRDLIVVGVFSDGPLTDDETLAAAVDFHDAVTSLDGVAGDTMISPRTAATGPVTSAADAEALVA